MNRSAGVGPLEDIGLAGAQLLEPTADLGRPGGLDLARGVEALENLTEQHDALALRQRENLGEEGLKVLGHASMVTRAPALGHRGWFPVPTPCILLPTKSRFRPRRGLFYYTPGAAMQEKMKPDRWPYQVRWPINRARGVIVNIIAQPFHVCMSKARKATPRG